MKATISKQEVGRAMEALAAAGKKPTLQALYAARGNRGSLTTIQKLRTEIQADTATPQDSSEGLQAFRQLWAGAVEEGRAQKETECVELREMLETLLAESERTGGELVAAQAKIADVEAQRDSLLQERSKAKDEVAAARADRDQVAAKSEALLERITELQERHAVELSEEKAAWAAKMETLQGQFSAADKRTHELEMELARSEAQSNFLKQRDAELESERNRAKGELTQAQAQIEKTAEKLAFALDRREQMATAHAEELAVVGHQLAEAQKQTFEMKLALAGKAPVKTKA